VSAEAIKRARAAFPSCATDACPMLPAAKHRRRVPPEEFLTPPDYLLMQREWWESTATKSPAFMALAP
jgi:hypothetical protein